MNSFLRMVLALEIVFSWTSLSRHCGQRYAWSSEGGRISPAIWPESLKKKSKQSYHRGYRCGSRALKIKPFTATNKSWGIENFTVKVGSRQRNESNNDGSKKFNYDRHLIQKHFWPKCLAFAVILIISCNPLDLQNTILDGNQVFVYVVAKIEIL